MSDNDKKPDGKAQYERISITMNNLTGEITVEHPANSVLSLGMLEYAREMIMVKFVRASMLPRLVNAGELSPHLTGFKGGH